jgi:hypothetical protein
VCPPPNPSILCRMQERWLTYVPTDSDVLYFNILGRSVIVLNSVQACHDLLDKRGQLYSDRPRFVLFEVSVKSDSGSETW